MQYQLGEVGKPGVTAILRRLLKYAEKTFGILSALDEVVDARKFPQIPTSVVTRSIFTMCLAKLGSLNALEQLKGHGELRKQTRGELPSADSIGRVADKIVSDTIRDITQDFYRQLKRNKVLVPPAHGLMALIVDGHESHATYKRHCTGCMEREIDQREARKRSIIIAMSLQCWLVVTAVFYLMPSSNCPVNGKLPVQSDCLREY